jgi:uncharacterized protein YebE (UPF0316 family)
MQLDFLTNDSTLFVWVILPLLIFLARIADQSIGTLRLIFVSKGYKYLAPILGFFEVIIWLLAMGQIFKQLDNTLYYIAYGAGFAAGNFVGILLDEKLSLGTVLVRIIPKKDTSLLVARLQELNFGLTTMAADGSKGPVDVVMIIIPRKRTKELIRVVKEFNPAAFFTVEEVKSVSNGFVKHSSSIASNHRFPHMWRKSK